MDNEQSKPVKVIYYWKYIDEALDQIRKSGMEGRLAYSSDSDAVTDGVQNNFKIYDIPYKSTCPGVDIFAVGITSSGEYNAPGFWPSGNVVIVKEAGGIDSVETSFEVLSDSVSDTLVAGDHLETPSEEIMRVESVTPGTPNDTLTVERGAHATTAASVLLNAELAVLTPRCGMERIILTGDTSALAAPVLNSVNGVGEGILLQWSHSYTGDNLSRLSHFKVYYSDVAAINISDALTYDGTFEVAGNQTLKVFNPLTSTLPEVDTTFYFVITAWSQAVVQSAASNELSGKAYGTIQPNPNGPPTSVVTVEVNGSYRLKVEAKKPTGTNSALGVSNVKKATIEVYYATAGAGVPTAAAGQSHANQTLIGSYDDTSLPYSVELGVSATGFKDYWARAKFTDGSDVVGSWGLSTVFELNAENNTTDTGVPTGVAVAMLVDTGSFTRLTIYKVGVTSTGNNDSASECQIAFRVDSDGTFAAGDTLPFTGATAAESVPKSFGGYPAVFHVALEWNHAWEITARIKNAYGWSAWITPEAITISKVINSTDTDVCALAGFGAWTVDTPHPDGWSAEVPEPNGQQVTFTYALPTTNESTVHRLAIEGTTAASFPTETVRTSQAAGSLVAVPGTYEATVTGVTATLNQYAGEFLKIGSDTVKNTSDTLQVFQIASNTAGDPFTITITGTDRIRNISAAGAVTNWQIIQVPIWSLVNFYLDLPVMPTSLGALAPREASFSSNVTGMKFRARVNNAWGFGGYRESTTAAAGSATPGTATYKSIGGIDTADIKDEAVVEGKIGAGAVTAIKAAKKLQPISSSVRFTPTSNIAFDYSSGTVTYGDGTTDSITGGSKTALSTNTTYWLYYTPGDTVLYAHTSMATANSGSRVILAIARTTATATEFCTVAMAGAGESVFGVDQLICGTLSAISANIGSVTAGTVTGCTIQTSATAAASGGIVLNGTDFTVYDTTGNELLKIDKTDGLTVYSPTGDPYKVARIDHTSFRVYDDSGTAIGVKIAQTTDTAVIYTYWDGTIIGSISGTNATLYTVAAVTDLQIISDNFNVSVAGNITTEGRYVSLIAGGATSYLIMRRAGDGATRYFSIAGDDSLVVGAGIPA